MNINILFSALAAAIGTDSLKLERVEKADAELNVLFEAHEKSCAELAAKVKLGNPYLLLQAVVDEAKHRKAMLDGLAALEKELLAVTAKGAQPESDFFKGKPIPSIFSPNLVVDQIMPQRKPAYAVQNAPNFGNSIFGRTEALYQKLALAAQNIAQQDMAVVHEGRGVMLIKRENTFVLLSVIGQADLPNREFAELHLALEAAAMFLSGLVSGSAS